MTQLQAKEERGNKIEREEVLEEIKFALKDVFVATVRKVSDELKIRFPSGQTFTLTVWES